MNAATNRHVDCVVWMLSNGSSLDENTKLRYDGTVINNKYSCEDILKNNGLYEKVKRLYSTKSSRK